MNIDPLISYIQSDQIQYIRELGKGSYGCVSLALLKNPYDSCIEVAVKEIKSVHSTKKDFYNEINILMQLQTCPNIIKLLGVCFDKSMKIIMKFYENGTLLNIIQKINILDIKLILNLLQDAQIGISFMHNHQIIHRDIKPTNMVITKNERLILAIADFGLACSLPTLSCKVSGYYGTSKYMAPEIQRNNTYDGYKVDVFAFGITCDKVFRHKSPLRIPYWINPCLNYLPNTRPKIQDLNIIHPICRLPLVKKNMCRYGTQCWFIHELCQSKYNEISHNNSDYLYTKECNLWYFIKKIFKIFKP